MTNRTKYAIGGFIIGLILLIALPGWAALAGVAIILAALAIPVFAYFMLDPSQRRRLREQRRRRQLGN